MDDRLARRFLENNIFERLDQMQRQIDQIQSLGTNTNYLTVAQYGALIGQASNGLHYHLMDRSMNYLINGVFRFAQRQALTTLTTIADNKKGPDRWRITRENADIQYQAVDAQFESSVTSLYYGRFKKITNAGKFHIVQSIDGVSSLNLRNKTIIFQIKMKASAAKNIRMGVIQVQNGGALNTIPATLVTAFGADGTDPTLGANLALISAAETKAVTTSWATYSVKVTVPTDSFNILPAVWTDADFAANDILDLAEADVFVGDIERVFLARQATEELLLCLRFCCKTFPIDSGPAQSFGQEGAFAWEGNRAGAVNHQRQWRFPVEMFAEPTITTYNPSAANAQPRDVSGGLDFSAIATATPTNANNYTFNCTGNAGTVASNVVNVHILADADTL